MVTAYVDLVCQCRRSGGYRVFCHLWKRQLLIRLWHVFKSDARYVDQLIDGMHIVPVMYISGVNDEEFHLHEVWSLYEPAQTCSISYNLCLAFLVHCLGSIAIWK